MSYQVDTSKLITLGNLDNFYSRLWNEIAEDHDRIFSEGCATKSEVDEACFGVTAVPEQCPDDPNGQGEHSWTVQKDGSWTCDNCGAVSLTDPTI